MSKESFSALAVILFLAAMGASAAERFGHDGPGMRGHGDPGRIVEFMARKLELDDTQTQELRNVVEAARPQMEELREKSRNNREAIAALDVNDPDYGAKLQNLSEESGYLATQATQLFGQLRADISAELTDEQRLQLAEAMSQMREKGGRDRSGRHRRHSEEESAEQ